MAIHKSIFFLCLWWGVLSVTDIVRAQTPRTPTQHTESFNQAATQHRFAVLDLRFQRGLRNPDVYGVALSEQDITAEGLAETLALQPEAPANCCVPELGVPYAEQTSILFYAYSEGALQIWLLDKNGIQGYHRRLIAERQITESVSNLRKALGVEQAQRSRWVLPRGIEVVYNESAAGLPVETAIEDVTDLLLPQSFARQLTSTRHLLVVPILNIGTVPYAMLQPFGDDTFLVDQMSISVAPSLYDIGINVDAWNSAETFASSLIVGNPWLPDSEEWSVPPLPGAEREARAVAQRIEAESLLGRAATKAAIIAAVEDSEFIYFATHGVSDLDNPLDLGFLMFSAPTLEAGRWTASEIQQFRLTAEMAVLSACQTGLGGVHDAGMIGVARAFQIAGVPRVVMSLWNVNDDSTSELMQSFVKHLDTETIPSEALRKAMLETKEIYPNPSDWAAFVMFGTPR